MPQLQFDKNKCAKCRTISCLTKCQYMNLTRDTARTEMAKIINGEDSFVLHNCITCYGCEEYCKQGNHPFYLICERQEEMNILPTPKPVSRQSVQFGIPWTAKRGGLKTVEVKEPVLSLCVFPQLGHLIQGKLFQGISVLPTTATAAVHFFCQLAYVHNAKLSVSKERLPTIIENIARHNVKEVIFLHDECYGTFTSYCSAVGIEVPFKSVHLFEYLYNRLKELKKEIRPLNLKAAYQRPCSSRMSPDKLHFVDDIFNLIGVESVKRKYVGEKALCCGGQIMGQAYDGRYDLAVDVQRRNVEDMVNAGAELCVFNCPACFDTMRDMVARENIRPIFMSDLCRLAIGEKPDGWR